MSVEGMLDKLFNQHTLSQTESHQLFDHIMQGKLLPEQIAGALIALKLRGETVDEISGAVTATLENAQPFPTPNYPFADIVGTGGDGQNTINISTASSIVAASMGFPIAKHGSRGVSSKSGASDVLSALGIHVAMSAETARKALDELGLCFLFAPHYHAGFKHAAPVRQALKTRTIFNLLGPLVNPARPKHQLLGVYAPELLTVYAETVAALGHQHTIVVHGSGLDEVAVHGETRIAEIQAGNIRYYTLNPSDFRVETHSLDALRGGKPSENAAHLTALLQGKGNTAHIDAVAVNVAMLMRLFGHADLKANVAQVKSILTSGKPFETLTKLSQYS